MGAFAKLRPISSSERETHRNTLDKLTTFDQLKINQSVRLNILEKTLAFSASQTPTPIQKVAIKALAGHTDLDFKVWLLAAETGSGKTLAYLAPLLSKLVVDPIGKQVGVRSVVLVPTLELVSQVEGTINEIAPQIKCLATSTNTLNSAVSTALTKGLDILVTTPGKVENILKHKPGLASRSLECCHTLIIDEADSLMNQSFIESTTNIIKACPALVDLVLCTASIPKTFDKTLRDLYPSATRIVTPSIHRVPKHIDFRVVNVSRAPYHNKKELALQQALYSIWNDNSEPGLVKRVVVFVNKTRDAAPLAKRLCDAGYPSVAFDKNNPDSRKELLEDFINPPTHETNIEARLKVLVTTDIFARGVDMKKVRNVILFDMPWSSADLLHRAGRTGRLNSKGRVILLADNTEYKGWVKGLETIVNRGQALA